MRLMDTQRIIVLGVVMTGSLLAQRKSCAVLTRTAPPAEKGAIYLRAPNMLSVERRKANSEENSRLNVYLEGVNPYKFGYSATAQRFPADDATIQQFLSLLGIPPPPPALASQAACPQNVKVTALRKLVEPLRDELNAITTDLNALGKQLNTLRPDHDAFVKDTNGDSLDPAQVPAFCGRAESLLKDIEELSDGHTKAGLLRRAKKLVADVDSKKAEIKKALDDLNASIDKDLADAEKANNLIALEKEKIKSLEAEAKLARTEAEKLQTGGVADKESAKKKLSGAVEMEKEAENIKAGLKNKVAKADELALSADCRGANTDGQTWIDLAKDDSKALGTKAAEVVEKANELDANLAKLQATGKIIDDAHRHAVPLTYRLFVLDTGSDSETDRLIIHRTDLRQGGATPQDYARVELIGVPDKFSLSGGVGFSTLSDRKVIRRTAQGEKPTDPAVTKFDYDTSGAIRPAVLILLNAHLRKFTIFEKNDATFALSSGIVGSARAEGTQLEYTLGPSLGLLKNKMFLNFGLHLAKVESLAGGFGVNNVIPADLKDPLPTKRNWSTGFMFSVSYSFYGLGNRQQPSSKGAGQ